MLVQGGPKLVGPMLAQDEVGPSSTPGSARFQPMLARLRPTSGEELQLHARRRLCKALHQRSLRAKVCSRAVTGHDMSRVGPSWAVPGFASGGPRQNHRNKPRAEAECAEEAGACSWFSFLLLPPAPGGSQRPRFSVPRASCYMHMNSSALSIASALLLEGYVCASRPLALQSRCAVEHVSASWYVLHVRRGSRASPGL